MDWYTSLMVVTSILWVIAVADVLVLAWCIRETMRDGKRTGVDDERYPCTKEYEKHEQ